MRGLARAGAVVFVAVVLFVASASMTHAAPPGQGAVVHVVKPGETLVSIALHYGTSVAAIQQANQLRNANLIRTGQRLSIPGAASPESAAPPAAPQASSGQVHRVRPGENLSGIAARYHVSVSALMTANGLSNPDLVRSGQSLVIPGAPAGNVVQPSSASQPLPAASGKRIEVSLSKQAVYAYQHGRLVYSGLVSTGLASTPTPVGSFKIRSKHAVLTMSGPGYYRAGVPHVMFFYEGYSLHGTYWHDNFGQPMSHGCVNLTQADAAWFFDWAPIGTEVVIRR